MKKVFIFLAVFLLAFMNAHYLKINGEIIIGEGNIVRPYISGKVHFDGANILTLEEASINTQGSHHGIDTDIPDFKMVLLGANMISTLNRTGVVFRNTTENLITGGGSLHIQNSATLVLLLNTAKLTINNNTFILGNAERYGITGMNRSQQSLTIDGAKVKVKGEHNGSITDIPNITLKGGSKIIHPLGAYIQGSAVYYNGFIAVDVVEIIVDNLGTNEKVLPQAIKIYPNPASSQIHVVAENKNSQLYILDASGKVLLRKVMETTEMRLDISQLPKGIYYMKIDNQFTFFIKN